MMGYGEIGTAKGRVDIDGGRAQAVGAVVAACKVGAVVGVAVKDCVGVRRGCE